MKKLTAVAVIAVAMAIGTSTAHAENVDCQSISEMAEQVMKNRQAGVPLARMADLLKDNNLYMAMVEEAYRSIRYSTARVQQRAVTEMGNRWYLACLEANR